MDEYRLLSQTSQRLHVLAFPNLRRDSPDFALRESRSMSRGDRNTHFWLQVSDQRWADGETQGHLRKTGRKRLHALRLEKEDAEAAGYFLVF